MTGQPEHNPRIVVLNKDSEVRAAMDEIRADPAGVAIMTPKFLHCCVKLTGVGLKAAIILKQEVLARGGEAAVAREVASLDTETTDVLISATYAQYTALVAKLRHQPFGLGRIAAEIEAALTAYDRPSVPERVFTARGLNLPLGRKTYVMGILNVTPDSFSDGGNYPDLEVAVRRAKEMVVEGADIIDIGGESTRPGASEVPDEEELRRVVPVVERLANEINTPLSVDTTKPVVAERSLAAGAHIINDVSGLHAQPEIGRVAARYRAGLVLMHCQSQPRTMQEHPEYSDLMGEILQYLREGIRRAQAFGLGREHFIVDPGIGFGKTVEHNLTILRHLSELAVLGLPVLVGTSRKSFIGRVLDVPVDERVEGTAATVTLAIAGGADFVRVHDVREMARAVRMTDAVVRM